MYDITLIVHWKETGRYQHGLRLKVGANTFITQMFEGRYVRGGAGQQMSGRSIAPWIDQAYFPKPIENILIAMLRDIAALMEVRALGEGAGPWTRRLSEAMSSLGYDVWKWPHEPENPEWDDNVWLITPTIQNQT